MLPTVALKAILKKKEAVAAFQLLKLTTTASRAF